MGFKRYPKYFMDELNIPIVRPILPFHLFIIMGVDLGDVTFSVFKSVFVVYCFGVAGAVFSRLGIIDKAANRGLGFLTVYYFFPCLFFVNTMRVITIDTVQDLWFLIVLPIAHVSLFFMLGRVGASIFFPSKQDSFKFLLGASIAYANCGNMVISVISTLGLTDLLHNEDHPEFGTESPDDRVARGIGYVSLYVLVWLLSAWTWLWNTMDTMRIEDDDSGSGGDIPMVPFAQESEEKEKEKEEEDGNLSERDSVEVLSPPPLSCMDRFKKSMKKVLTTPPLVSTLFGILIGLIPPLRALFFNKDSDSDAEPPLEFMRNACELVGKGAIPVTMLVLGVNLAAGLEKNMMRKKQQEQRHQLQVQGEENVEKVEGGEKELEQSTATKSVALFLCVVRLLISPALGIAFAILLFHSGLVDSDDYMLRFVVMAVTMGPTANTIVIMCQLRELHVESISILVFQQYLVGLLTIPFAVVVMVIYATEG